MKYGALSQSNISSTAENYFKVADGDTAGRPNTPVNGMIRYNTDHAVVNLGTNSGNGRFEVYDDGAWSPLISLIDFASPEDLHSTGNVTLKVLADMIQDFFVQGMGLIEVNQDTNFSDGSGHALSDAAAAKANQKVFMPEGARHTPAGISNQVPSYITPTGSTGAFLSHHNNKLVQQIQPIFNPIVGTGMVYQITIPAGGGGGGYDVVDPPAVVISTGGGEGARVTLLVDKVVGSPTEGQIISGSVRSNGSGYHPSYTKTYLKGGGGKDGEVGLNVDSAGRVVGVSILNPGSQYAAAPTVSIADGGTRAYAEPVIVAGKIDSVNVLSNGIDYIGYDPVRAPTVEFVGNTGAGATADVELGDGKVISVEVLRGGSGYDTTSPPPIALSGDGTGASFVVTGAQVDGGAVTGTTMVNNGSGYTIATASVPPAHTNSNAYIRYGKGAAVRYYFEIDIFTACGVPTGKAKDYKIGLFNSLYKAITRYGHMGNSAYALDYMQAVKMVPKWVRGPGEEDLSDYGIYSCSVRLEGVKSYYSAACGAAWFGSLTKFRNF